MCCANGCIMAQALDVGPMPHMPTKCLLRHDMHVYYSTQRSVFIMIGHSVFPFPCPLSVGNYFKRSVI